MKKIEEVSLYGEINNIKKVKKLKSVEDICEGIITYGPDEIIFEAIKDPNIGKAECYYLPDDCCWIYKINNIIYCDNYRKDIIKKNNEIINKQSLNKLPKSMREEIRRKYKPNYKKSKEEIKSICLNEKFDFYNKMFFNNELKICNLKWSSRLTQSAGNCYGRTIKLSIDYHRKYPEEIDRTLVHEMIHLKANGHGKKFKQKMKEINTSVGEEFITIFSKERSQINYVWICPNHRVVHTQSRKSTKRYCCKKCGETVVLMKI